ncbi:MAG: hypothetical protein WC508_03525 [Patescibacteria group bacterium]
MQNPGNILPKSYRKIGIGFLVLAIVAFVVVLVLISSKATIIINPGQEQINQDFVFDVSENASVVKPDAVNGKIISLGVEGSNIFKSSGSKKQEVKDNIVGQVTIINTSDKSQALVATTRLAAPSEPTKTLLRLNESINVAAGKKVTVSVYADDPANFKELKPMKLIIPGLRPPLQEKIYAQNSQTLSKEGVEVKVVADIDLKTAEKGLKDQLYQQVIVEANKQLDSAQALWPKLVSIKVTEFTPEAKAGDVVSEFNANMKIQATVIIFDESQLVTLAQNKLKNNLPNGNQLVNLEPKNFSYSVQSYNIDSKQATIKANLAGSSVISSNSDFIDKTKLLGLTEDEVKAYFSQFPGVKSVEVKFSPAWVKKTPRLANKIEIKIIQ